MTQSSWADATTRRIAANVKTLRGKRSAQWLAGRTTELGHPISRTAISNLEVGRKGAVEVPELLVLAKALGVPPLLLLFPGYPGREVEFLPGHSASSWHAAQWFTGTEAFRSADDYAVFEREHDEFEKGSEVIRLAMLEDEIRGILNAVVEMREKMLREGDMTAEKGMKVEQQIKEMAPHMMDMRRRMVDLGASPVPLPPVLAFLEGTSL